MTGPAGQPPHRLLADGDVRFVGDIDRPRGGRVAVPRRGRGRPGRAWTSTRCRRCSTRPRPPAEGAPLVHPELRHERRRRAAAGAAAGAGRAVRVGRPRVHRDVRPAPLPAVPMETRGMVASWDRWSDQLELVISGQGVHEVRLFYSRYFGIPEDRIRVIMGDVGGSFGQKVFPVNDEIAVVAAARKLGRPVKWIEDRSENLIAGGHARDRSHAGLASRSTPTACVLGRAHRPDRERRRVPGRRQRVPCCWPRWSSSPARTASGRSRPPARRSTPTPCGRCAYRGPWMMETIAREQMMDVAAARARHRPAGAPPPQRDPAAATCPSPPRSGSPTTAISPARDPRAGGRADRLRRVPHGPGSRPARRAG